jgi:hypothetical protein
MYVCMYVCTYGYIYVCVLWSSRGICVPRTLHLTRVRAAIFRVLLGVEGEESFSIVLLTEVDVAVAAVYFARPSIC